ncbi:YeeE/YedE family protein [Vibrio gallicus]|uniref:YeeE/YedE family protein n=1 Tax=Vibrio gallicus TaxID=190897 RepID=UPI0021C282DB|nr:YeeE/YedE family protein [Vibrio gallicus]
MFKIIALIAGVLFGLGMAISGMASPQKVIGFLDVAGQWDPSLAFVMGGALLVFAPVYHLVIKRRSQPILHPQFSTPKNSVIDKRLLLGASLFGIGWGLAGICPGPVVSSLAINHSGAWLFLMTMLMGMMLGRRITAK